MSRLSTFFKDGDTEFSVFYPKHHLVAVFSNLVDADRAKEGLRHAGCLDEDVISVSGEEAVYFANEHLAKDGFWGVLMTELSRLIGTEAAYADNDLAAAKKGRGVHSRALSQREGQNCRVASPRTQAAPGSPLLLLWWN